MLEVIEKPLVGLYHKHKGNHTEMVDISQFVKSLGLSTPDSPAELKPANGNTWSTSLPIRKNSELPTTRPQTIVTAEMIGLSLKVLAFLQISKNEYFDLETIPALQAKDWQQLGDLVYYLLNKKLVVIKGIDAKVYAKITPFGLRYLHACEATAC